MYINFLNIFIKIANNVPGVCSANPDCTSNNCQSGRCAGTCFKYCKRKLNNKNYFFKTKKANNVPGTCAANPDCTSNNCQNGRCAGMCNLLLLLLLLAQYSNTIILL